MSETSCGSGCGCGPKAAPAAASKGGTAQNGKGSGPRNMSGTFLKNYDGIRWASSDKGDKGAKARKAGAKFVKVY